MTPNEAIQGHLAHLDESLAECAQAVTAQSESQESLVKKVEELSQQMSELADGFGRLEGLLGNFVRETERLRADSRQLSSEVRPVLARLKAGNG